MRRCRYARRCRCERSRNGFRTIRRARAKQRPRIDTGGVDVNPAPVRLRELFARLRLHFEPIAFEKGLMLSFHGEQHVAQADPVLLERILRNLVSNAIRYTDDGGVLVSCRRRSADGTTRLLVQVWDSGIGISDAGLPRIFDEFYQVQSQRPLEAHQRKGLGLGLAIVKRLAALLDAPLSVRSRVGHGTVFSLVVAPGRMPRTIEAPSGAGGKAPIGLTLQGQLLAVVEDEAAVREGLVVLLQAWGADVVAFGLVFLREGLEEGHAAAEVGQAGQPLRQFARRQVVHHVAANQQVDRRAGPQVREVAEAREMQVAARAVASDRVFAAVEAEVLCLRPQCEQRCAPRAFAAADVQHRADRAFEVVFGGRHRQRDLALEPLRAADAGAAVPVVEIALVVGLVVARVIALVGRAHAWPISRDVIDSDPVTSSLKNRSASPSRASARA